MEQCNNVYTTRVYRLNQLTSKQVLKYIINMKMVQKSFDNSDEEYRVVLKIICHIS
jgi:hypothetical protein